MSALYKAPAAALVLALWLCPSLTGPTPAHATMAVGEVIQSHSKVFINFMSNHGRYSRDRIFRYRHAAETLSQVRQRLVEQREIENLPILISIPSPLFYHDPKYPRISREKEGRPDSGDTGDGFAPLGPCYKIHVVGDDSYDTLLRLTLALRELTPAKPEIDLPEKSRSAALLLRQDTRQFRNITRYHDPLPSPNRRYILSTVWTDGNIRFLVTDRKTKAVRKLEPLDGYMAAYPVWSPDSQSVAYASRKQIKLSDLRKNETRTIALPIRDTNEVFVRFDSSSRTLLFAGEKEGFSTYPVYAYDIDRHESRMVVREGARPVWGKPLPGDRLPKVADTLAASKEVDRLARAKAVPPEEAPAIAAALPLPAIPERLEEEAASIPAPLIVLSTVLALLTGAFIAAHLRRRKRTP